MNVSRRSGGAPTCLSICRLIGIKPQHIAIRKWQPLADVVSAVIASLETELEDG